MGWGGGGGGGDGGVGVLASGRAGGFAVFPNHGPVIPWGSMAGEFAIFPNNRPASALPMVDRMTGRQADGLPAGVRNFHEFPCPGRAPGVRWGGWEVRKYAEFNKTWGQNSG